MGIMTRSVAGKANYILEKGGVSFTLITCNEVHASVISIDKNRDTGKKEVKEHSVIIWRDGHFTCDCTNFIYSRSEKINLWDDEVRIKAECKHALAVKLHEIYKRWIRMILVPTDSGYALRSVEIPEVIDVRTKNEEISAEKLLPKVKVMPPRSFRTRPKIPFERIFEGLDQGD